MPPRCQVRAALVFAAAPFAAAIAITFLAGRLAAAPVVKQAEAVVRAMTPVLPKPPKHIHVMQPEIGSPCLVQGCAHKRTEAKGKFVGGRRK